ncbi:MAG: hypothetical protein JWN29_2101 [Acidimicrobiales bacterium]|nr:hypothetical protein [Acidimicrobiales bacterium]
MGDIAHAPANSPGAGPRGLRRPVLAFVAVGFQAAPGLPGGHLLALRPWFVAASGVLMVAWFLVNLRASTGVLRWGLGIALVGSAMNLVVMVPNGGMPVSKAALEALGGGHVDVADGHLYKHRLAGEGTILAPLGDVIPVRPLNMAASAGDAVLLVGILAVAASLALPRRRVA